MVAKSSEPPAASGGGREAPPSPSRGKSGGGDGGSKKRRGGRANRSSKKDKAVAKPAAAEDSGKASFDCSGAIAKVSESLFVSAVSGTRMGASLEATLLEYGVTAVVSTLEKSRPLETFTNLDVDTSRPECAPSLHEACDFMNETMSEGGAVFVHSKAGFARSEWAVLLAVGYLVKYESVALREAIERCSAAASKPIDVASKFRRELATFEEEALGEASVDDEWIEDESATDDINHSLSRQKLAENLNDRRLLKKKSPHK